MLAVPCSLVSWVIDGLTYRNIISKISLTFVSIIFGRGEVSFGMSLALILLKDVYFRDWVNSVDLYQVYGT